MTISYMLCFIYSKQCIKIISSKKCGLFSSVFKKVIPNNTTLTIQEVGWATQSLIFCRCIRTSHGIALTIIKFVDFYSEVFLLLFCLPLSSIEMNPNYKS